MRAIRKEIPLRCKVVQYIVETHWDGGVNGAADATGETPKRIREWMEGVHAPNKSSVEYLMHRLFVPEFRIVAEFRELSYTGPNDGSLLALLRPMLLNHEERGGIYAFYDSMANLVYLGKATRPVAEVVEIRGGVISGLCNEPDSAVRRRGRLHHGEA
jgi:hypothetical protein